MTQQETSSQLESLTNQIKIANEEGLLNVKLATYLRTTYGDLVDEAYAKLNIKEPVASEEEHDEKEERKVTFSDLKKLVKKDPEEFILKVQDPDDEKVLVTVPLYVAPIKFQHKVKLQLIIDKYLVDGSIGKLFVDKTADKNLFDLLKTLVFTDKACTKSIEQEEYELFRDIDDALFIQMLLYIAGYSKQDSVKKK